MDDNAKSPFYLPMMNVIHDNVKTDSPPHSVSVPIPVPEGTGKKAKNDTYDQIHLVKVDTILMYRSNLRYLKECNENC